MDSWEREGKERVEIEVEGNEGRKGRRIDEWMNIRWMGG